MDPRSQLRGVPGAQPQAGHDRRDAQHLAPEGGWTRRLQHLVRRPHAWVANGCRVDQDTAALLRDTGFSDLQIEQLNGGAGMGWSRTTIIGRATR